MTLMSACLDQLQPTPARIQNAILGGHDNTAADREIARLLTAEHPVLAGLNLQDRQFIERAVRRLAGLDGIRRFLDLGCGLPVQLRDGTRMPMVHESARAAGVDPRVVYVDNDPVAVLHMAKAVAGDGNVTVVKADLADPGSAAIGEQMQAITAAGEPVCVILAAVLQYWDAPTARSIVARYMDGLPPGSAVVISVARLSEEAAQQRREMLPSLPFFNHTSADVQSFYDAAGLRLYRGRVISLGRWPMAGTDDDGLATMTGGIGVRD